MKITKTDFFNALRKLGPHACLEFVLTPQDEIYTYLNEEIELDKVDSTDTTQFALPDYNVTITANKVNSTSVYVKILKKPDGFLAYY